MALDIKYFGTVSSGGVKVTAGANEVIGPSREISALSLRAISALTLKLNEETIEHPLAAGETIEIEEMVIFKITVKESGASYEYHGLV